MIALALAVVAPELPPLLTLDARAPYVEATIAGKPVRLRVDPAAGEMIEVNRSVVRRLGLLSFGRVLGGLADPEARGGWTVQIGPVRVRGEWARERVGYGGFAVPLRVGWTEGEPYPDADGRVSPALLPYAEVRFVRRAVSVADRVVELPVALGAGQGLQARMTLAGERMDVEFEPFAPATVATAAAGALLARANGGMLVGEAARVTVRVGVERPVREMVLTRPLAVAGFTIDRVPVRWLDWAGNTTVPQRQEEADEIRITGRPERQRAWPKIALGADRLDRCAEIAWVRESAITDEGPPRGRLRLACDFGGAPG